MALGLEVFNSATGAVDTDSSTLAINLNTMGTNRIAMVVVHTDAATRRTVSSVADANGLTWALYEAHDYDTSDPTNNKQRTEVWWAFAAAQQTSNPVTVTLSGNSRSILLVVGAISGVHSSRWTNPFDADPTLPAKQANPSASDSDATETFSTHDSACAVFAIWASAISNVGNVPVTPSGWTLEASGANSGTGPGSAVIKLYVFGKIYSAKQTSTVVNLGPTKNWGMDVVGVGGDIIFPHSQAVAAGF